MEYDEVEGMEAAMTTGTKIKENILGLLLGLNFSLTCDIKNTLLNSCPLFLAHLNRWRTNKSCVLTSVGQENTRSL